MSFSTKDLPQPRRLIKALRDLRGLDQSQVAKAARLTQPLVSMIENGKRTPTKPQAERLARVLDADVLQIFPELAEQGGDHAAS